MMKQTNKVLDADENIVHSLPIDQEKTRLCMTGERKKEKEYLKVHVIINSRFSNSLSSVRFVRETTREVLFKRFW